MGTTAFLIAWASTLALAQDGGTSAVRVTLARGDDPAALLRARPRAVVSWDGGPADVWTVAVGTTRATPIARDATSPIRTGPLAVGAAVRVTRGGQTLGEVVPARVWTPADVAAWSGDGLRGAHVTAIAPSAQGVWVGTDGGGLSWWDGRAWAHLDRRVLGSDSIVDLVVSERTRWVGLPDALVRISPEGRVTRWTVPEALPGQSLLQVVADGRGGVWVRTDSALIGVHDDVLEVRRQACAPLVETPDGPVATCGHGARRLLDDERVDLGGDAVIDWIARADGAWIATPSSVYAWVKGEVVDPWSPAAGRVWAASRVGDGLAIAAGRDGLIVRGADEWHVLTSTAGLPGADVVRVEAAATFGRAWVGTDRGLALANVGGTATPLPLAPLAAGVPVTAIEPFGVSAALATADGLRWVGRGAPAGWRSLTVAVGAPAVAITRVGHAWWAASSDTAFTLDADGALWRWPLHDELVSLSHDGARVLIATRHGLRWWVPGATMLSPMEPIDDVRDAALGPDGSRWVLDARGVTHGPRAESWPLQGGATLVAMGPGAVVASVDGVAWLTSGREQAAWTAANTGPIVDVDAAGGRTWALGADGRLWTNVADAPRSIALGAAIGPRAVRADAYGAWVASDAGLFRVLP